MAKILGWYKKRPGKQVRNVPVSCPEGFRTRSGDLDPNFRVVVIEANNDYDNGEEVLPERLNIELSLDEAVSLANQLLAAVEYARKP
jgi:hypothetical protein